MKVSIEERVRAYDVDGRGTATIASLLHYAEDSRLALAQQLFARGVPYPLRNLARAQQLVITKPLPVLGRFRATSFLARVGTTSFEVGTALDLEGERAAEVRITFVVVDEDGKKTNVDARLHDAIERAEPMIAPALPSDFEPRFVRDFDVLPRDENSGRHVSHARLAEHASDNLRLGASEEKLDARAHHAVQAMSIVYERETRFPDRLRVAIGSEATGTYDVTIARASGPLVARARFLTGP